MLLILNMHKRGSSTKIILIVIIAILILSIIGSIYYFYTTYEDGPVTTLVKEVKDIFADKPPTSDSDADYTPEELAAIASSSSSSSTSSSSSGGGGGGSGSSSSGGTSCQHIPINYYLINFKDSTKCEEYSGEICVRKLVNCSINFENRDPDAKGFFETRLIFVEIGKDPLVDGFNPIDKNFEVEPLKKEKFEGTTLIQSTLEDGLANKEINCYFNTLVDPYKIVC